MAASLISNQNNFSYFWATSHLNPSNDVSGQLAFRFREKKSKYIFNMAAMVTSLNLLLIWFYQFWIYKSSQYFLSSLESVGLSTEEKKFKIDFQGGN